MLYNDERPKNFDELLGQDMNKKIFKRQVETGQYSHAYLFYGHHGSGKTSSARLLARASVCQHPTENGPCGVCESCKNMENSVDYIEIDAASNTGVDAIRDKVIETVRYQPVQLSKKIIIIDEVHMLSASAFNALLKTIEEPPKNVILFLCTTEVYKVPKTIVSRCQKFVFEAVSQDEIVNGLKKAKTHHSIDIEDEALEIIAKAANGAMRDALSILDQFKNAKNVTKQQVAEIVGFGNDDIAKRIIEMIEKGEKQEICTLVDKFLGSSNISILINSLTEEILTKVIVSDDNKYLDLMEKLSIMKSDVTPLRLKTLLISKTSENRQMEDLKNRIAKLEKLVYEDEKVVSENYPKQTEKECVEFDYNESVKPEKTENQPLKNSVQNDFEEIDDADLHNQDEDSNESHETSNESSIAFDNPFGW